MTERNVEGYGNRSDILPPERWGVRHWQCLMLMLGFMIAYTNRICVSIAIIAIQEQLKDEDALSSSHVGMILSSFGWGYTVFQIPSGHLARMWSPKMAMGIGILVNGIGGLLCPLVFDEGGWIYLCACRVVMGVCQACCLPCIHTLLAKWVPPNERGRLGTLAYAGGHVGIVIGYPISGALVEAAGWRSVFYFFGASAILWSIVFLIVGADSPAAAAEQTCCRISERERQYIESSLGMFEEPNAEGENQTEKTPWKAILTSLPFWSLVIVHCGNNWGSFVLHNEISLYMHGVLGFGIKENGLISAIPFVVLLLLTYPVSWLSDWNEKRGVSRGAIRKICNTIGHWGPGVALVGISFTAADETTLPVVLLIAAGGLNVGALCGFQINHMDLSPKYAGLLVSFTNCPASVVGLLAPLIIGGVVTDMKNADQWAIIFYITGGIYFIGNLIFIMFGSGETQYWDNAARKAGHRTPVRPRASSIVPDDAVEL